MDKNLVISKTLDYVAKTLEGDSSGHDFWHIYRVWEMAKRITKEEKQSNLFVVELGALLHDIADWKFTGGDEEIGPSKAEEWLKSLNVDEETIDRVKQIIRSVSFKGAKVKVERRTIEEQIVHDADKLDAIGAIGIARTFAYGGNKGLSIHDPERKSELHESFETYKASNSSTINHFYEKLLLLKDLMYTRLAKDLAKERHEFMKEFLERFYSEWNGKS